MANANSMVLSGGYIYLAAQGCPTLKVPVQTADQASMALAAYRDENCLGNSEFKARCGNIYDNGGRLVARVSYNGRVWSPAPTGALGGELLQEAPCSQL